MSFFFDESVRDDQVRTWRRQQKRLAERRTLSLMNPRTLLRLALDPTVDLAERTLFKHAWEDALEAQS